MFFVIFILAFLVTFAEAKVLTSNFHAYLLLAINCIAITIVYVGLKVVSYLDKELKK